MAAQRTIDVAAVRAAVEAVPDPELPPVTIGMLGMVHAIEVADTGEVLVELLPTYSGCPAIAMIERDVQAAVSAAVDAAGVSVRFRFEPAWSPQRISDEGHERLREFGIAPPGSLPVDEVVTPAGRRTLPLAAVGTTAGDDEPRPCPYCGSLDTSRDSAFGPTPCRDLRFCAACQQPFEAFRSA